jgi:hypothetical protein
MYALRRITGSTRMGTAARKSTCRGGGFTVEQFLQPLELLAEHVVGRWRAQPRQLK